jgi:DNA-directed RNA polymerase subunit M/transcription elongation factor TFIIS
MSRFRECERCGCKWAYETNFGVVEVRAFDYQQQTAYKHTHFELCPNCTGEVLYFIKHPEEYGGENE